MLRDTGEKKANRNEQNQWTENNRTNTTK